MADSAPGGGTFGNVRSCFGLSQLGAGGGARVEPGMLLDIPVPKGQPHNKEGSRLKCQGSRSRNSVPEEEGGSSGADS